VPYKDPKVRRAYIEAYNQLHKEKYAEANRLRRNGPDREFILWDKRRWHAENKEAIHAKARLYYQKNRDAIKAKSAKYAKEHPEEVHARRVAIYYRNHDKSKQSARDWYYANRERALAWSKVYRAENRSRLSATQAAWRKLNPERRTATEMKRRAIKRAAAGSCSYAQLQARIEFYGGKCWVCRTAPFESIDHVKPLSKGGSNWPSNLRPCCKSCNSKKRANWPFDRMAIVNQLESQETHIHGTTQGRQYFGNWD
jgi:5-methylcytosine-specific restriction endonuclease McrA